MLKRETQKQLWRDLLARSAAPDEHRGPSLIVPTTLLLISLALYLLAQI
jgi:hypothetical protein